MDQFLLQGYMQLTQKSGCLENGSNFLGLVQKSSQICYKWSHVILFCLILTNGGNNWRSSKEQGTPTVPNLSHDKNYWLIFSSTCMFPCDQALAFRLRAQVSEAHATCFKFYFFSLLWLWNRSKNDIISLRGEFIISIWYV